MYDRDLGGIYGVKSLFVTMNFSVIHVLPGRYDLYEIWWKSGDSLRISYNEMTRQADEFAVLCKAYKE
ncbi:MAG: hypothetical protein A2X81_05830 [Desulfobacterales bacterium GWB2_56_26]|nr:MAG: hypothetical protein A2X81_05830 [Desulfobacterales bacterium GWB2_56_26]